MAMEEKFAFFLPQPTYVVEQSIDSYPPGSYNRTFPPFLIFFPLLMTKI